MSIEDAQRAVHEAIQGFLDDEEIMVAWMLTVDVAGVDGNRYLAHRAGGGNDGTDHPTVWAALGMLEGSIEVAKVQLLESTRDLEEPEDNPSDD